MRIRNGQNKWSLRQLLVQCVPRELADRPKQRFVLPIMGRPRGPLREWAENLLNEHRLRDDGIFEPEPVRQAWHEHWWNRVTAVGRSETC